MLRIKWYSIIYWGTYYVPLLHLIYSTILKSRHYNLHFIEVETEAQRGR